MRVMPRLRRRGGRGSAHPPHLRGLLFNGYFDLRESLSSRRRAAVPVAMGPHQLAPWFLQSRIGKLLNLRFAPPEEVPDAQLGLWFEMKMKPPLRQADDDYFGSLEPLNDRCADISKTRVMRIAREVFGYGYEVDPAAHHGRVVCKSDGNGVHDGRIVQAPCEPEPGMVYQRLIDNRFGTETIEDIRICVVGAEIPYVLRKRRSLDSRFGSSSACKRVAGALSAAEEGDVIAFAQRFGLDLGELDVLRDRIDGRLYVVDVNDTPFTPPRAMLNLSAFRCMRSAARSFERQYL